ncbi:unnamed protein product, partial [Ectocarpus sp. 12 AP-2014]
ICLARSYRSFPPPFLLAIVYIARRVQPCLSLGDREVYKVRLECAYVLTKILRNICRDESSLLLRTYFCTCNGIALKIDRRGPPAKSDLDTRIRTKDQQITTSATTVCRST